MSEVSKKKEKGSSPEKREEGFLHLKRVPEEPLSSVPNTHRGVFSSGLHLHHGDLIRGDGSVLKQSFATPFRGHETSRNMQSQLHKRDSEVWHDKFTSANQMFTPNSSSKIESPYKV